MEISTAAPPAPPAAYRIIPLANITRSKTNPRTIFDQAALDELAHSIAENGVLEPILVRPQPGVPLAQDKFEIVAGERRYRASVQAKIAEIPCIVKQLNDEHALELQIIENVQRQDLHPLEEARGYRDLTKTFKHSVEDLAAKIGKSPTYVYRRIQLNHLDKKVQKLFEDGTLSLGHAQLIARVPVQTFHNEIAKEAVRYGSSVSALRDTIQRKYMLDLSKAPFDTKAADLHESAGACVDCPKRTGNQAALFADIGKADYCTDLVCFDTKVKTHCVKVVERAKEKGQPVIDEKAARKLMPSSYSHSVSGHYPLDHTEWVNGKNVSLKSMLPKGTAPTLVVNPHYGSNHLPPVLEVVPDAVARAALKEAGYKSPQAQASASSREAAAKTRLQSATRFAIFEALRAQRPAGIAGEDLRMVATIVWSRWYHDDKRLIAELWAPDPEGTLKKARMNVHTRLEKVTKAIPTMDEAQLCRLIIDTVLSGQCRDKPYAGYGAEADYMLACAKRHGVDIAKITAEQKALLAPKKKPAKKAARRGAQ